MYNVLCKSPVWYFILDCAVLNCTVIVCTGKNEENGKKSSGRTSGNGGRHNNFIFHPFNLFYGLVVEQSDPEVLFNSFY